MSRKKPYPKTKEAVSNDFFLLYKENPRIVRGFRNRLLPMSKQDAWANSGQAPFVQRGGRKGGIVKVREECSELIEMHLQRQTIPQPEHAVQSAPVTQGSLQCGKSPRDGRQKISAATGRSTNERAALGLGNKGYARPAFGGTSRRRSIMKTRRLSGRVSLDAKGRVGTSWLYQTMRVDFRKKYRKIFIYNFYSDAIGRSRRRYSQKGRA